MRNHTFQRSDRLKKNKLIQLLFQKGNSFYSYPFRVYFLDAQDDLTSSQVLFSIPTRHFKLAVDRNKLRRRSREAYRLNKPSLNNSGKHIAIGFVYTANKIEPYATISKGILGALGKLPYADGMNLKGNPPGKGI